MQNIKKKITLLLPVHQREDIELNFHKTMISILKHINSNFVLLILVDGKLSNTFQKKINEYKKKNVKILKSPKVGLSKLLNIGIKKTKTKWIGRLDSDDIYTKNFFIEGLKLIQDKSKNLDLFGGQIIEFDEQDKSKLKKKVPTFDKDILFSLKFRNPFNHMTIFFKRDLAIKLGGYPDIYLKEDYALWIKFIGSGARFCNSHKVFSFARIGVNFYKRRKGFDHLYSEMQIQKLLLKYQLTNFVISIFVFCIRSLLILMPKKIIKVFYKKFLRY